MNAPSSDVVLIKGVGCSRSAQVDDHLDAGKGKFKFGVSNPEGAEPFQSDSTHFAFSKASYSLLLSFTGKKILEADCNRTSYQ